MPQKFELKISDLRRVCDPKIFKFRNTSEVKPLDTVIGQERAVEAIDFGLNMNDPGYNIFVTGLAGTGKSTIVRHRQIAAWSIISRMNSAPKPSPFLPKMRFDSAKK